LVDIEKFADEWGPEKIVQLYDPQTGIREYLSSIILRLDPAKAKYLHTLNT